MEYEIIYQAVKDANVGETWTLIIVIVLTILSGSGIISIAMNTMLKRMEKRAIARELAAQENRAERKMLLGITHDRIICLGKQHIRTGGITIEDYENISKYLYEPYKKLRGNGKVEKIMKIVDSLPIVPCEYTNTNINNK